MLIFSPFIGRAAHNKLFLVGRKGIEQVSYDVMFGLGLQWAQCSVPTWKVSDGKTRRVPAVAVSLPPLSWWDIPSIPSRLPLFSDTKPTPDDRHSNSEPRSCSSLDHRGPVARKNAQPLSLHSYPLLFSLNIYVLIH